MRKLLVIVFSSIFFCSFAEDVELRNLGKEILENIPVTDWKHL